FARRDRAWKKIDLCVGNTETGEVKVLFSEESEPYFNVMDMHFAELNDGEDILWWSERDGWGHLYLYDREGNLKNRITQGPFHVAAISKIDTAGRMLYLTVNGKEEGIDPYYDLQYRVGLDGSGMDLLTAEHATHDFDMSGSRRYFVDNYSRIDTAPEAVLKDNSGRVLMELEKADISKILEAGWQMPETFIVKSADGITDQFGVMWKPFDFDPEKEYPIITYVYPGPFSEYIPKSFSPKNRNVALAQLGFIVVSCGNRGGAPWRGKWYHTYGYGNARDYGLADKKAVIEELAARHSFIDVNRVGIYGHSGGGFMSTAAMLVYPDFFKVAVSSAGNHDNNIYNIWWGEFHYGVKEKKVKKGKEGESGEEEYETVFEANIPTNWEIVKNLKGHLLLVTGDMDSNVHPANTIRVADALIKAGKRFDFMIMPGKRHGFGDYSKYFVRMLWNYFSEHLIGDYRTDSNIYDNKKNN
ncbi:MAG: prolyl oligopeptidase family serine peptidase, partial [bacterium]|nr:prolyl oligopeptidase family serine peptidase [bacterium]